MLEIVGLDVFYDEVQAVRNVNLEVRQGEIVTLIGANGAGKTTTLKAISGLLQPAAGQLDEPSLGLAPLVVAEVARSILLFRDAGITILLVEQNANLALALSNRGYVMETGRITMTDTALDLRRNPDVLKSYFGASREYGATS
jgi:branched-chain amino acid transport system ATP-binding protein